MMKKQQVTIRGRVQYRWHWGIVGLLLLCGSQQSVAFDIIPSNSKDYYRLGGGSDISLPPVTNQKDITVGGDIDANLGFSCGFNPSISISNSINEIKDSAQGIEQNVISSATSAVASMPMYLLSKSNKDLYNMLQNTIAGAEDTFHLSTKSCQDAMNSIKNGKSPYQDWFSVSDSQGWLNYSKAAKKGQDVDVNHAKKQLDKKPSQYGSPWVHKGQNSGGSNGNQVPIKVIYDVVVAGYNTLVDPSLALDSKTTQAKAGSGMARYWKTANDAGNWARLVLGDITISSKAGQDQTTRGVGLMTVVQTCPDYASNTLTCAHTVAQTFSELVSQHDYPIASKLRAVSSNELMATPDLIAAIRNKTTQEQAIAISKWSQDVALQNVVDQALLLRRVLIAGSQTKPVHNLRPALTAVESALAQLNKDIQDILFQFQVRNALMTHTATTILGDQQRQQADAVASDTQTQAPRLRNGAVYKSSNEVAQP